MFFLVAICKKNLGPWDPVMVLCSLGVTGLNHFKLLGLHLRISHSLHAPVSEWLLKTVI